MEHHGWPASLGDPYAELKAWSRSNLIRILGTRYQSTPEMAEAERIVEATLEFRFVHNTNSELTPEAKEIALLSSKQISLMGIGTGVNSRSRFNTDLLASDEQVYFFADITNRNFPNVKQRNGYGSNSIVLDSTYAEERGWISVDIMHPQDLLDFAKSQSPGDYETLVTLLKLSFPRLSHERTLKIPATEYEVQNLHRSERLWHPVRNLLHWFDFTPSDFATLVKEALLKNIQRLLRSSPDEARAVLKTLPGEKHLQPLLEKYVFQPLGLPSQYELKVPVAVPPGKYRQAYWEK